MVEVAITFMICATVILVVAIVAHGDKIFKDEEDK